MADDWYCRLKGKESGPWSSAQLKALAAQERLKPEDSIRLGANGAWLPAGRIKGLFPSPEPASPQGGGPPKPSAVPSAGPASPAAQDERGCDWPVIHL